MYAHQKFSWVIIFFLLGITLASFLTNWRTGFWFVLIVGFLIISIFLVLSKKTLAILAIFFILGSSFYFFDDSLYRKVEINFSEQQKISGLVQKVKEKDNSIEFDLVSEESRIRVYASKFPRVKYGDQVEIITALRAPEGDNQRYFEKEGVHAISAFPELEVISRASGGFRRSLFNFRDTVQGSFEKNLPSEQATFMTGITLGKSAGFSSSLKDKLAKTGTTHLVALSGYNITIIAIAVSGFFVLLFSRRLAFLASVAAIVFFVLMTGGEASVVRAAIMGILVLLADQMERSYSFKNAILVAGLVMVMVNPKVLIFDLGFQLSFLALIGIVYLRPILGSWLRLLGSGTLGWKDNLLTTLAAQITVLPLILFSFGFVSAFSVLTNVLILTFIPITMLLGLLIFTFSFISSALAAFFAFLAKIFLGYELAVINFFSKFPLGVSVEELSIWFLLPAYFLLFWLMYTKGKRGIKHL